MVSARKLPDAYNKSFGSDLYKLLRLAELSNRDTKTDFKAINESRDINFAYGDSLDMYGEMFGISRDGATDEQYRVKILLKIGKLKANSDCNSMIQVISDMFNIDKSSFLLTGLNEYEGVMSLQKSGAVRICGLSSSIITDLGYTSEQVRQMINDVLPVGVRVETLIFDGTLKLMSPTANGGGDMPTLNAAWDYGQSHPESALSGDYVNPNDSTDIGTHTGGTLGYGRGEI